MRLTPAYSVEKPGAGVCFASFITGGCNAKRRTACIYKRTVTSLLPGTPL